MKQTFPVVLVCALALVSCKDELAQPDINAPEHLINTVWYDTEPISATGAPTYSLHFLTADSGYVQDSRLAYMYALDYYYHDGQLKIEFIDGANEEQTIIATVLGKYITSETDTFLRVK